MLSSNFNTQIRLFESLPRRVQTAIVAYANAAEISPATVIEFALSHFLELVSGTALNDLDPEIDDHECESLRARCSNALSNVVWVDFAVRGYLTVDFEDKIRG